MNKLTGAALRKENELQSIMSEFSVSYEEAIEIRLQRFRDKASKGGKNSTGRPFRDIPGLAKRAGSKRGKN